VLAQHKVDALVAIGGEDTLGVAKRLTDDGIPVVGVPKTIDNDLGATDYTSASTRRCNIATEALDRLRNDCGVPPPRAGRRGHGRHAGWIALALGHRPAART